MSYKILLIVVAMNFIATSVNAEVISPVEFIKKNGFHSEKLGDDGKIKMYTHNLRTNTNRVKSLEQDIIQLPKHAEIFKVCDLMRGGAKAKLIEEKGMALDVAVTNYGYKGSTIACVLKYMVGNNVGTQLFFGDVRPDGMYTVIVTD